MSIVYVFTWDIELLLMSAGWRWSLLCLCIWFGLGAAELMSSFFFLELDIPGESGWELIGVKTHKYLGKKNHILNTKISIVL